MRTSSNMELTYRALALLMRYFVDTIIYDVYHDRLTENLNNALMQEAKV
ncbi:hypothetical protein [Ventosimonas gracilis]|nr:hypothetical protein [Ventosimonas gracilis]